MFGPSVRGAAHDLLNSAPRGFDNADMASELEHLRGDRDNDAWRATIRTALWTLRNDGHATLTEDGKTISVKWLNNAEGPVSAGPSGDAGLVKEGGETDAEADPDHDHIPGRNNGHGRGPAVLVDF